LRCVHYSFLIAEASLLGGVLKPEVAQALDAEVALALVRPARE
jgi:hypothetical protein